MKSKLSLLVGAILISTAPASSQEEIRLTVISGYAPTAAWVGALENYLIPQVDAKLAETGDYKINWNRAWGTITQPVGELDAVENGLGDFGVVQTAFHPDKLPIYSMTYVTPFTASSIDDMTKVINDLSQKYTYYQDTWTRHNQVVLTALAAVDNYHLVTKEPVSSADDLNGMKICGAGPNLRWLQGLGVVGVSSPLSDWYNNIRSGICEGTLVWAEAADNFKLVEVAPNLLKIGFGGVNSMALSFNRDKWEALPQPVKDVFVEVAEGMRSYLAVGAMDKADASLKNYTDAGGTIVNLDDEAKTTWANSMPPLASEWAESLEKQGIPGREILADYIGSMKDLGHTPSRDWLQ